MSENMGCSSSTPDFLHLTWRSSVPHMLLQMTGLHAFKSEWYSTCLLPLFLCPFLPQWPPRSIPVLGLLWTSLQSTWSKAVSLAHWFQFLWIMPTSEIAGSYIISTLSFLRKSILPSKMPSYTPTAIHLGSLSPHPCWQLFPSYDASILTGARRYLLVILPFVSLMMSHDEHSVIHLLHIQISPFEKSIQITCPFFLLLNCLRFLYSLDMDPLSDE
jgi:hypothetical protein